MHSSFVCLALVIVSNAKILALDARNNQTVVCCDRPSVVCNCNASPPGSNEAIQALEKKLDQLIALFNSSSPPTAEPTHPPAVAVTSCKKQHEKHPASTSQVYNINFGSQEIPVYCHMGEFGCGDGGWTLAMKISGTKRTFHYHSFLWSDKKTYNLAGGKTGFDMEETKLPSYWNTNFSKICLGMRIGQQINFVSIGKQANSLHSLIADGTYHATSLGRNKWKSLIGSDASIQTGCNKEGFNVVASSSSSAKARIGILGNDQGDCVTCDSRIGFGTGGATDDSNSCGDNTPNGYTSDNGAKNIKAMGYILVQ